MKRLLAVGLGVVAFGFLATPNSKAQGISISFGNGGGCYYPQSYGYGDYYGGGYGYNNGCYPYYRTGYYYNSGNPYGYRRSYYRGGNRYARYRTYRSRRHYNWQNDER